MKNYKIAVFIMSFALFGVGYLCVFGLFGFVFFGKMHYMNVEFPTYLHTKITAQSPQNAEILVLGDSRAKAGFIPQSKKHLNLAIGGSMPFDGYHTLKRYLKHNKAPKILILSYMGEHYFGLGTFWERSMKFGFINFFEFSELIENARNLGQCGLFGKCQKIEFFKYHLNFENFNAEIYNAFAEKTRFETNKKALDYLQKTNGHFWYGRAQSASGLNSEASWMKSFKVDALSDFYLHKIADLAKAHNIAIFHYQMPFNQSSIDKLDPKFKSEYNAFLNSMWQNYGIYSLNEIHAFPDSDFGDPSHLYNGANKSTADILQKIEHYFNPPNLEKNATFKNNANLENNATKTR